MYTCIYVCVYIYIYIYMYTHIRGARDGLQDRHPRHQQRPTAGDPATNGKHSSFLIDIQIVQLFNSLSNMVLVQVFNRLQQRPDCANESTTAASRLRPVFNPYQNNNGHRHGQNATDRRSLYTSTSASARCSPRGRYIYIYI